MDKNVKINAVKNIPLTDAWKGHFDFARWSVNRLQPTTTVDLGVDLGFSTFSFAIDEIGTVYGVDWFKGDAHAGFRDSYDFVMQVKNVYEFDNVEIIKSDFNDLAKTWDKSIDILHIDGYHTYDAVKNDYETWSPFVREGGLIMMHDTHSFPDDVGRFFNEIDLPKLNFSHSHGLGVVSTDAALIEEIRVAFGVS
jgi:hypothetical protein